MSAAVGRAGRVHARGLDSTAVGSALAEAVAATVRAQLRAALTATGGDRRAAAGILGVSRSQLYQLLAEHPEIAREFPVQRGRRRKTPARG